MPPYIPNQQVDPIGIYYQNGGNLASQMYVWNGSQPVLWDGQVSFSGTISIGTVSGSLTNNSTAPTANNIGVLSAICSTTALGYTQGRQVLLRTDTTGALIVSATLSTTGLATSSNQTDGSQKAQVVNTGGATQAFGSGVVGTTTPRMVLGNSNPYSTTSTNTAVTVTTAATVITAYYIGNPSTTTAAYLQLFNATAGAVTLGSTAPTQSFFIPAGAAANVAGLRKSFGTAFSIAATLDRSSSTAPTLALDVNFDYE